MQVAEQISLPTMKLPYNYITIHGGIVVKWFIGDYDYKNKHWQAWGSCLGMAYQLASAYNREKRMLLGIKVLPDNGSIYFNQQNFDKLTAVFAEDKK